MPALVPWNPLIWVADHWAQILGWSGVVVFAQRVYKGVSKVIGLSDDLVALKLDVTLLKENHLPHLQKELESVNQNISGLRDTTRDGFTGLRSDLSGLRDDMRAILTMRREE